jgi:hypothetical protein
LHVRARAIAPPDTMAPKMPFKGDPAAPVSVHGLTGERGAIVRGSAPLAQLV